MTKAKDKGLYQVYAHHPVYGRNLVYIGKTDGSTFGQRIAVHRWETGSENDPERVEYYVGRLAGETTPSIDKWTQEIRLAEALLINSHGPAYNSSYITDLLSKDKYGHVRVLNWGAVRSLHREVSGLMWSPEAERFKVYNVYGDTAPQSIVVAPVLTG
jgi:hypothetical protein